MGKIRVNFIVILVVCAMIALLLIQAFQTMQIYDKKSTQFRNEVQTTLERIAVRHEKAEDVRKFMRIANSDFSGDYRDVLKEEFQNLLAVEESISIKDTTIIENGKKENYLLIKGTSFDSLAGVSAEQRVLARDVRQLRELYQGGIAPKDSVDISLQLDQRVIKKMFEKAKFVNEMMIQAFRENVYDDPSNRLDIFFLDSIIRNELKDDNLPQNFKFSVVDVKGSPIKFGTTADNFIYSLDSTDVFTTALFPSNFMGDNLVLQVYFPSQKSILLKEMWLPLTVNLILVFMIVGALVFMFRTILSQKKLAELRNDFISNMTHEFKTPISTISLACQAMNDTDMIGEQKETISPYVKMIDTENQRLGLLVERILQSAILDRGQVQLKTERVLLNEVIHEVAHKAQFRIQSKGGAIQLDLPSELIEIHADNMHLTNVISNLVDNAIKYSGDNPIVSIQLRKEKGLIKLSVSDKGIGIKKEHLNKIFDNLYRIPTGNVHNVKGFGLGLSYVKAVAKLHDWNLTVTSKYGEGSTFSLEIKE